MADYTITIDGNNYFSGGGGSSGGSSGGGGTDDTSGFGDMYKAYKAIKGFAPVAAAASITGSIFSWQISLVGRNTGNSLLQEKINNGMKIAGQVAGVLGGLAVGIGTANPALIIGSLAGAVGIGIGYAKEAEQLNYERRWENIGIALSTERAGASLNRSRAA